jgi:hypothetical protein
MNLLNQLFTLIAFFIVIDLFGQSLSKRYDSDPNFDAKGVGVIEKNSDYVFIDGNGTLSKVDILGNTIWSIQTSDVLSSGSMQCLGENLCQLGDGNFLKVGQMNFNLTPNDPLIFYNLIGWAKVQDGGSPTYLNRNWFTQNNNLANGIPLSGSINDVTATSDGGAIIGGTYKLPLGSPQGNAKPLFIKMDVNATVQWIKTFDPAAIGNDASLSVIEECLDGEFICGGNGANSFFGVNQPVWISKANLIGGVTSWTFLYQYASSNANSLNLTDIIELSNGNFAIIGNDRDRAGQLLILNSSGTLIYHKEYLLGNLAELVLFNSVIESPNGDLLITGSNQNFDENLVFLNINQTTGHCNFAWRYLESKNNSWNNSILTSDDFLLLSSSSTDNLASGSYTKSLIKMNSNGEVDDLCKVPLYFNTLDVVGMNYNFYNDIPVLEDQSVQSTTFNSSPRFNNVKFDTDCCNIPLSLTDYNVFCDKKTYILNPPNGNYVSYFWSTGETTESIVITPGNTYSLTVVDANGCVGTATYTFNLPLFDDLEITSLATKKCCGQQIFNAPIGFNSYQWVISPATAGTIVDPLLASTEIIWTDLENTSTITVYIVFDNGCEPVKYEYEIKGCCADPAPISSIYLTTDFCDPSRITDLVAAGDLDPNLTANQSLFIVLNNDLIVDADYVFRNCPNIIIENGHKIIVEPNIDFTIDNSDLTAKCNYMWDGIYVSDPSSTVFIVNTSEISQALNAVASENGGNFNIQNSSFIDDYIGVKVGAYNNPHPGIIRRTTFSSATGNLLSPYNAPTDRMNRGVEVIGVDQLTIGDFTSIVQRNEFDNMDFGIWSRNSDVEVYNNRFTNITTTNNSPCFACPCLDGTAICASSSKGQMHTLTVGGAGLKRNLLLDNKYGIWCNTGMNLNAVNNTIWSTLQTAIKNENSPSSFNFINTNNIRNFNIGTEIKNSSFSNSLITFNNYNVANFNFLPPAIANTAILIQNDFSSINELEIRNNEIKKIANGIFMRNVDNVNINPSSTSDIFENEINFGVVANTATTNFYGIRLENSAGFSITDNTIDKQNGNNPSSAVVSRLRGISLLNSPNNIVANNSITKMGAGIRTAGSCYPATIECNELNRNYFGVHGELLADIGHQVQGPKPTGNTWINSISFDLDLVLNNQIFWYYNGTPPSFSVNAANNLITNAPVSNSNPDNCSNYSQLQLVQFREDKLGSIVRNEKLFNSLNTEFELNDKNFAYRLLKRNPSLITLGNVDDSLYQNFYAQCELNCIGKFNEVVDYLYLQDTISAQSINSSIVPNNNWETNLQLLNIIYAHKIQNNFISSNDSVLLNDLAWSNVIENGPAIFSARAILNLDIEDLSNGQTRMMHNNIDNTISEEELILNIQPNPSNGIFICSINLEEDFSYVIYDIKGKLIFSKNEKLPQFLINLTDFENGIYIIEVLTSETIITKKIVKQN